MSSSYYLPEGIAAPVPDAHGLDAPYWSAARRNTLVIQHCPGCGRFQWSPEWLCHTCHRFNPEFVEVPARGQVFSWERVWHANHEELTDFCPYLVVIVALEAAPYVRMVGNLLGDSFHDPRIGERLMGVFEHHKEYSLLQWKLEGAA